MYLHKTLGFLQKQLFNNLNLKKKRKIPEFKQKNN